MARAAFSFVAFVIMPPTVSTLVALSPFRFISVGLSVVREGDCVWGHTTFFDVPGTPCSQLTFGSPAMARFSNQTHIENSIDAFDAPFWRSESCHGLLNVLCLRTHASSNDTHPLFDRNQDRPQLWNSNSKPALWPIKLPKSPTFPNPKRFRKGPSWFFSTIAPIAPQQQNERTSSIFDLQPVKSKELVLLLHKAKAPCIGNFHRTTANQWTSSSKTPCVSRPWNAESSPCANGDHNEPQEEMMTHLIELESSLKQMETTPFSQLIEAR